MNNTTDFMAIQAKGVLERVSKLGKETKEEQDAQDADLRRVPFKVADRYLSTYGGSLAYFFGSDNHGRVINRHGKVIAITD